MSITVDKPFEDTSVAACAESVCVYPGTLTVFDFSTSVEGVTTGDYIKFVLQTSGSCSGAAESDAGGSVGTDGTITLSLGEGGTHVMCFADMDGRRRRSLAHVPAPSDADYEYLPHVAVYVVSGTELAPVSPPPPANDTAVGSVHQSAVVDAEDGLDGGAVAGIVILCLFLCCLLMYCFLRYRQRRSRSKITKSARMSKLADLYKTMDKINVVVEDKVEQVAYLPATLVATATAPAQAAPIVSLTGIDKESGQLKEVSDGYTYDSYEDEGGKVEEGGEDYEYEEDYGSQYGDHEPSAEAAPPVTVKIVVEPSRANDILQFLESKGDGSTYSIERVGKQAAITGTLPATVAGAIGDEFAGVQVFAESIAQKEEVETPTEDLAPPPMKDGLSLETITDSLVKGELGEDEKEALLLAIGYEREMEVGETRYALQLAPCQWEWTEQSHAREGRQVYASVTRNALFGPHIEYHAESAHGLPMPGYGSYASSRSDGHVELASRMTFAESAVGTNDAVGYKAGIGLSTGAGIKNDSLSLKLFGTGISIGRNMGISFLDSEVKADVVNTARQVSFERRRRRKKTATAATPGQAQSAPAGYYEDEYYTEGEPSQYYSNFESSTHFDSSGYEHSRQPRPASAAYTYYEDGELPAAASEVYTNYTDENYTYEETDGYTYASVTQSQSSATPMPRRGD